MDESKKYWFPAKPPENGWGWGLPITWQGWLVFIGFFVVLIAGIVVLAQHYSAIAIVLWAIFLGSGLIGIFYWKGEPPGPLFPKDRKTGQR